MLTLLLGLLSVIVASGTARANPIEWITVGAPGNACDVQSQGCFGAVADVYRISKYETTNAQYAEFLNAVGQTDTNALYNTSMSSTGIERSGSSGSFSYSVTAGKGDMPVVYVSFWDSLRFANWLHNGKPTGAQGDSTTEDGAYTITDEGISTNSITRNAGAIVFLTSEDEWYKAAYYDAVSMSYFDYPAGTDVQTTCATPGATPNTANCDDAVMSVTDVGAYTGSASPAGTFDQGGNVWERNEAIVNSLYRVIRGGGNGGGAINLAASSRGEIFDPANETSGHGFRVASIPEPGTGLLVMAGMLGLVAWRRHRA
jgi:formylglycine-generating enzyme required for sulfatase activity